MSTASPPARRKERTRRAPWGASLLSALVSLATLTTFAACWSGTGGDAASDAPGGPPPKEDPLPSPSPEHPADRPTPGTPAPPAGTRSLEGSGPLDFLDVYAQAREFARGFDPEAELYRATINDGGGGRIDPNGRSSPAMLWFHGHDAERDLFVELRDKQLTANWIAAGGDPHTFTPTCGSAAAWNAAYTALSNAGSVGTASPSGGSPPKVPWSPAIVMGLDQGRWYFVFRSGPPQSVNPRTCAVVDATGRPKGPNPGKKQAGSERPTIVIRGGPDPRAPKPAGD